MTNVRWDDSSRTFAQGKGGQLMARETLKVRLVFDQLICERSADWSGRSEPYPSWDSFSLA